MHDSKLLKTLRFFGCSVFRFLPERFLKSFYGVAIICVALVNGCSESGDVKLDDPAVVYSSYCYACHDYGAINAPKLDDLAFWSAAQNDAALRERFYQSTLQGIRAMPAKGTCLVCTEKQLRKTVDWMIQQNLQPKKS